MDLVKENKQNQQAWRPSLDNSSFVSFILKFSPVTKGHGVRDYPCHPFFTESMTPHNFFRKQKEYTNEFISRVIFGAM